MTSLNSSQEYNFIEITPDTPNNELDTPNNELDTPNNELDTSNNELDMPNGTIRERDGLVFSYYTDPYVIRLVREKYNVKFDICLDPSNRKNIHMVLMKNKNGDIIGVAFLMYWPKGILKSVYSLNDNFNSQIKWHLLHLSIETKYEKMDFMEDLLGYVKSDICQYNNIILNTQRFYEALDVGFELIDLDFKSTTKNINNYYIMLYRGKYEKYENVIPILNIIWNKNTGKKLSGTIKKLYNINEYKSLQRNSILS